MRGILKIERSIVKISDVLRTRFKDTCPLLEKYYLIKKNSSRYYWYGAEVSYMQHNNNSFFTVGLLQLSFEITKSIAFYWYMYWMKLILR